MNSVIKHLKDQVRNCNESIASAKRRQEVAQEDLKSAIEYEQEHQQRKAELQEAIKKLEELSDDDSTGNVSTED